MVKRLTQSYPVGTQVEIWLRARDRWLPGQVVGHNHPGLWVKTKDGGRWYVTNHRRIRLRET